LFQRPIQSAGIRQAGLAFRLARHRVPIAPVLAFGGRPDGGGFLLCRVTPTMLPARSWLASARPGRRSILRRIGQLLRRCHDAGCRGITADSLMIETSFRPRLRLVANGTLRNSAQPTRRAIIADLRTLDRGLALIARSDIVCIIQGYYRGGVINADSLRVTSDVLRRSGRRAT
jgi:hypothetical protein